MLDTMRASHCLIGLLAGCLCACANGRAAPPGLDATVLQDAAAMGRDASGTDSALRLDASHPVTDAGRDAAGDAGHVESDGGGVNRHAARALIGPSYMGSVNNGAACSQSYPTRGHEPSTTGTRHPLFLYFVGTAFVSTDPSASYDNPAPMAVTQAMAERGYVSLSVAYDNGALAWLSDHVNQLACLFGNNNGQSLIAAACALPNVDCDLGIATWGHSQGGYVAAMAYNVDARVSGAWATGYGGDGAANLPKERLRVVNGEADTSNGQASTLNMITGLTPSQCPDPDQCLRADGSGWIIVRRAQLADPMTGSADHCWFDRPSCGASMIMLEPNWVDPSSTAPFALSTNADWLATTARR